MRWHDTDPERLAGEVDLMHANTNASLIQDENGGLAWIEELVSEGGDAYRLMITYPTGFPYEPPRAYVLDPDVSGTPHRLSDGSLCLWDDPSHGGGVKTTALVVRNRAVVWFLAYEAWRLTGKWGAPQHGGADALS